MVLKRKLPTQEAKVEKKVEEVIEDNFDMAIETDEKPVKKVDEGHDLNDAFPDTVEDRPEDFIPEELRALEGNTDLVEDKAEKVESKITPSDKIINDKELKEQQENQEVAPVTFDDLEDNIEVSIDETPVNPFEDNSAAPAELPGDEPLFKETPSFDVLPEEPVINFDNQEHANWQEVVDSKNDNHKDDSFDSFETVSWENDIKEEAPVEKKKEAVIEDDFIEDSFGSSDNGGIVPEIPGLDFDKPAEFMGQNSKDLNLNSDAKRKLVGGVALVALVFGGIFAYSNMDVTNDVANRLTGSITEANQDIAETKEEEKQLIDEGVDVTKAEKVIDFSELSGADDLSDEESDLTALDDEFSDADAATEINLLEPAKEPEKTSSGKEVIKATGEEEMPDDVEEGVNLIANITEELAKQEAKKKGLKVKEEKEKVKEEGNAADINKKVDEQLAEYRKLLAQEEDPGKKVKPGAFFDGSFEGAEDAETVSPVSQASVNVAKVKLSKEGVALAPTGYAATAGQVGGNPIVEYPKGVARQPDDGIRQLDHFRSLMVEKEDKRVRMPKGVKPGLRNQGFPKFKVISIVPNYGLIGEYSNKKGILMIGDAFQGWELVGVYESYAEFKKDTRKHIISLR